MHGDLEGEEKLECLRSFVMGQLSYTPLFMHRMTLYYIFYYVNAHCHVWHHAHVLYVSNKGLKEKRHMHCKWAIKRLTC